MSMDDFVVVVAYNIQMMFIILNNTFNLENMVRNLDIG